MKQQKQKKQNCKNVSVLPTFNIVIIEDDNIGVESITFTDNPIHGKRFIVFNDENTDKTTDTRIN